MKPATWTHGDLEQSSPGARMRVLPPACDPAHPACVPSVTAPPSPQATTDQAGPPPDNTALTAAPPAARSPEKVLTVGRGQVCLQHVSS